jgi:SAM-dependent methyltransferase
MITEEKCSAVVARYPHLDRFTRYHLSGRLRRCPYEKLISHLPANGMLLDIGCGYGHFAWYLIETGRCLRYTGTDIDPFKIAVAQSSLENVPGIDCNLIPQFLLGAPQSLRLEGIFDAITIIDVLYLLPWRLQAELLEWCFSHLAKNASAVMVVKNPDTAAGPALFKSYLQESIMVHLLGRTRSSGTILGGQPPETYKQLADSFRLHMEVVRMSRTVLLFLFRHSQFRSPGDNQAKQT